VEDKTTVPFRVNLRAFKELSPEDRKELVMLLRVVNQELDNASLDFLCGYLDDESTDV
jgi:hypothetical protein